MKKILFLVLLLSALVGQAQQNFTVTPAISIEQGDTTNSVLLCYTAIQNLTNDTLWLNWERFNMNLPSGWDMSVCDEWTCHPDSIDGASFYILANDVSPVVGHFIPWGNVGTGTANITIYDPSDSLNNTFTASYEATIWAVGIDEANESKLVSLYPNPATDQVTIQLAEPGNVQLYSQTGQLVMERVATTNSLKLNLNELPAGLYFVHANNTVTKLLHH